MQEQNNNVIEYGSLRQRKMNDVLCELSYIERQMEAIRKEVLKSLQDLNSPMDKSYIYEKVEKIQDSIAGSGSSVRRFVRESD